MIWCSCLNPAALDVDDIISTSLDLANKNKIPRNKHIYDALSND